MAQPRTALPLLFLSALSSTSSEAQNPTWSEDVACIVYSHCTSCHNPGGIGHFSMLTYADAYAHRTDIKPATTYRFMPPWPPDEDETPLAHERVLTQHEIDVIADWVDCGAPEGNQAFAPDPPVYTNNWELDDPDLSGRMEEYVLPATSSDYYRCFILPIDITAETWVDALEVVPGNHEIVHHVQVFRDTTGQGQILDQNDPGIGWEGFGGPGISGARLIGGWVPGAGAYYAPEGFGIRLPAGSDIIIQVHYPSGSSFELDSTRVNLRVTSATGTRELLNYYVLNHVQNMVNGPIAVPPDQVVEYHEEFTLDDDISLFSIGPHAHLVCTAMSAYAVRPGNDTLRLIDIPKWNFMWQGFYQFRQPVFLPAGTVLHGFGTYDNTTDNPLNPHDPPEWIYQGESTNEEMMLFSMSLAYHESGDEDIVIDTAAHWPHISGCEDGLITGVEHVRDARAHVWPVPARDELFLGVDGGGEFILHDMSGRLVRNSTLKPGDRSVPVGDLARGVYACTLLGAGGRPVHHQRVILE
ncbi:MAG: hypothetical protein ABI599_07600 [Flavobacteriales bacterium]